MHPYQSRFLSLCFALSSLGFTDAASGQTPAGTHARVPERHVNHHRAEREFKRLLRNPLTSKAVLLDKIKDCRFPDFTAADIDFLGYARQQVLGAYDGLISKKDVERIMKTAHQARLDLNGPDAVPSPAASGPKP